MTGPKISFWHRLVVLMQAADHGGLPEVAALALPRAAGQYARVIGQPAEDPADPLELVGVVQRAVQDVRRRPGRPTLVLRACSASASANSSAIRGATRTRVAAVQSCPALK